MVSYGAIIVSTEQMEHSNTANTAFNCGDMSLTYNDLGWSHKASYR